MGWRGADCCQQIMLLLLLRAQDMIGSYQVGVVVEEEDVDVNTVSVGCLLLENEWCTVKWREENLIFSNLNGFSTSTDSYMS